MDIKFAKKYKKVFIYGLAIAFTCVILFLAPRFIAKNEPVPTFAIPPYIEKKIVKKTPPKFGLFPILKK